jgi:hypothetical protein
MIRGRRAHEPGHNTHVRHAADDIRKEAIRLALQVNAAVGRNVGRGNANREAPGPLFVDEIALVKQVQGTAGFQTAVEKLLRAVILNPQTDAEIKMQACQTAIYFPKIVMADNANKLAILDEMRRVFEYRQTRPRKPLASSPGPSEPSLG